MKSNFEVKCEKKITEKKEKIHNKPEINSNEILSKLKEESSRLIDEIIGCVDVVYRQELLYKLETVNSKIAKNISQELKFISNSTTKNVEKPLIRISAENEIVHFSMDENLPHKIVYDRSERRERYYYDTDAYYMWCRLSSLAFIEKNGPIYFDKTCAILFISYYDKKSFPVDHDNLDVKYFIDGAAKPFLKSDNAFNLSVYFDAFPDERNHTEIYLGVRNDVLEIMAHK